MAYKDILKVIPTLQATALTADNVKFMKKKKKTTKGFVKQSVKNIIGASLIKETADFT